MVGGRRSRARRLLATVALIACMGQSAPGEDTRPPGEPIEPREIEVPRTEEPPTIDGVLSDQVWSGEPLALDDWISYNPLYGERIVQITRVWVAYDADYLYFAFHCTDPEPQKVKTSISRRDRMFSDDWVGLALDSVGSGQTSYDMFINPSGIQGDILASSTSGEDVSPDWVWDSAGLRTAEGYDVEIRLPLKSVLRFAHLERPTTLEAIPSFTYARRERRESQDGFAPPDTDANLGLTAKYGLTSSITLDGTINPDFSQIESDAFQVTVNRRFPVFFSEKRPFFMEGSSTFELAGTGGDSNMIRSVHTRRIVDPSFGFKASGSVGNLTFATLSASDAAPGRALGGEENPYLGKEKLFNIGRALYNLGEGSYLGGILADSRLAGGNNRVAGGDVKLRFGEHEFSATGLLSSTLDPVAGVDAGGFGGQATYSWGNRSYSFFTQVEHYEPDFQMDTAFLNRTGVTRGAVFGSASFYPERYSWLKRIVPFVWSEYARDRIQGGNDRITLAGVRMHFTRQGFLRFDYGAGRTPWAGRQFEVGFFRIIAELQPTNWFRFSSHTRFSRTVFYDPHEPFSGDSDQANLRFTFQPTDRLNQSVDYDYVGFDRASTGERVFTVHIVNSRTTYQFSRHFYLRAILQYDSSRYRALTDFLASYELTPGTVVFLGYGSIIERRDFPAMQDSVLGRGDYLTTQRGLFFKASYLHRF